MPARDEDIAFAPVTWLAHWIRSGQLTSLRLTHIYLERLARHGPALRCVVTTLEREALRSARRADREIERGLYRGPLHGVPWGAKDLLDHAGGPTTWGAAPYRDRVAEQDGTVVRRLKESGAVLVAKLSLGALAAGDVWFAGRTRNPFDRRQGSSGSSAGSAAAVAAGLVGFAIGSETMGSILSPSIRCGVTGLRPSFGRVPRTGAMALVWSMDKLGPMCRTVEDAAHVLATIQGPDGKDESVADVPFGYDARQRVRGMRVGYVPGDFRGKNTTSFDRQAFRHLRALGVSLEPVRMPDFDLRHLRSIIHVEAAAAFDELTRSDRDDLLVRQGKNAWPNQLRTARFIPAVDYVQAMRVRRRLMVWVHDLLAGLDAFVTPRWSWLAGATNYTGQPALALRSGVVRGRRPTSVILVGPLFREDKLLVLGRALERRFDAWSIRPQL